MSFSRLLLFVLGVSFIVSCSPSADEPALTGSFALRPLTSDEAVQDFRQMVSYFREFYGPMEYKEERFQFSFDAWAAEVEAEVKHSKSDAQTFGLYSKFLARLQDGHVGINFNANSSGVKGYTIPIFIVPVGSTFLVADVAKELAGATIANGDEIISIDGNTPEQLLAIILKYRAFATPESNRHFVYAALRRDFYMTELKPVKNAATIVFKKPDGRVLTEDFVWKVNPLVDAKFVENERLGWTVPAMPELQQAAGASLLTMSQPVPFFTSPQVNAKYNFRVVTANDDFRAKWGLTEKEKPNIYAALYRYQGKNILLVRNYIYSHRDFPNTTYLKGYKAILDQWESMADVLVLDQTHNGGGSYCEEFARLFINSQKDGFVQRLNVDRKWIIDLQTSWADDIGGSTGGQYLKLQTKAMSATVERNYDEGAKLTEPLPIIGGLKKILPADYTWKKPMLVLIDELAGSCGDAFPMLIKNNGVAKLFGHRTMGLGGNVEGFILDKSQTQVRLTRGLFTSHRDDGVYLNDYMIENNGVTPDYAYDHTVEDFRAGFVGYVDAFSKRALEQIQ